MKSEFMKGWPWTGILLFAWLVTQVVVVPGQSVNIEIGNSTRLVLATMGMPTSRSTSQIADEEIWVYGLSSVTFRKGFVVGWDNQGKNLKVFMGVARKNTPPIQSGVYQHSIIAALGTPEAIVAGDDAAVETWVYPNTLITLVNGRIAYWVQPSDNFRPGPDSRVVPQRAIRLGSSGKEVAAIMGKPGVLSQFTRLNEEVKSWQECSVTFWSDTVVGYANADYRLPVFLGFKQEGASPIGLGSSREEVINLLGTPLEICAFKSRYETVWNYGYTSVTFRSDTVFSWKNLGRDYVKQRIVFCVPPPEKLPMDSVAAYAHSLNIDRTRLPKSAGKSQFPAWIIRDDGGNAYPYLAEDDSYYGEVSALTGLPKTVYVAGLYRGDGTYVKSHYRSMVDWTR